MKQTPIFLLLILIFSAGCASTPPKETPPVSKPARVESTPIHIDISHVEDRIRFLENILNNKDPTHRERETVLALLDTYGLLKKAATGPVTGKESAILSRYLFQSMLLVENAYFENPGGASDETTFIDFTERRNEIRDLYLDENYPGVIQRCLALQTSFPAGLTPEIGMMFAISLARDGMLEEAVEIGSEVARRMDETKGALQFRGDIIAWQLALGQRTQAVNTLEKITHAQDERAAMINDITNRIERTPVEPDQTFRSMFQPPKGASPEDMTPPMATLKEKVDQLARNHEFEKARRLLLKEKAEREEGPETGLMDRALDNIDEAETAWEESVRVKAAYQKETFEAAKELFEKEDHEGAIETLATLERTQGLNAEALDLRDRVIEGLINRERNRAAAIFLEAKKTEDPGKRRELLEASYKILKTLVEDYPRSPLNPKIVSHIDIVKREIQKLP